MFDLKPISTSDLIQILTFSGAVLALAVGAAQLLKQNTVAKAQFLRDSFEMLWKTYDPIGKEQVADFEKYPAELVLPHIYEARYKGNEQAIHRYIKMSKLYEYLALRLSERRAQLHPHGRAMASTLDCRIETGARVQGRARVIQTVLPQFRKVSELISVQSKVS